MERSTCPKVVRVQGFSNSSREDAKESLKRVIDRQLSASSPSCTYKITVVSACNSEGKLVALVDFPRGMPEFLSELENNPLGTWREPFDDFDEKSDNLLFDRQFLGFAQLHDPTFSSYS
jgi:hypothetical protein